MNHATAGFAFGRFDLKGHVVKKYLLTTLALSLATAFAGAADTPAPAAVPTAVSSGIELKNMDTSVRGRPGSRCS